MSIEQQYAEIVSALGAVDSHVKSLSAGKKVSATRGRVQLSQIEKQVKGLRKSILEHSKSLPTKAREAPKKKDVEAAAEVTPPPALEAKEEAPAPAQKKPRKRSPAKAVKEKK